MDIAQVCHLHIYVNPDSPTGGGKGKKLLLSPFLHYVQCNALPLGYRGLSLSTHTSLYTTEGGYSISQTKREKTGFLSARKMYMGDSANYFWIIDAFVSRPLLCCTSSVAKSSAHTVQCVVHRCGPALSMYPLMHSFP